MHRSGTAILALTVLIAGASACQCECDTVAPGYYGPLQAGSPAAAASPQTRAAPVTASKPDAATSSPAPASPASTTSADAGQTQPTPPATAPSQATPPTAAAPPAASGCDLSGRWLSTEHLVSDALGMLQFGHYFHYYEIEQRGDAFTITKGLLCGYDSVGDGVFATTADFHGTWAGTLSKVNEKGRTGSSVKSEAGCKLELQKWYTVRGATIAHYNDPSVPLPTADQKATASTPGWEDWDNDGNPGITGVVSGVVSGKIFVAPRMWTSLSGSAPDVSTAFKLPVQWNQEPNVMAYDGTPLLGSEAARAADATLHFAQFARLAANQASGDDAAICKSVVELAPKLTPEAAGL